MPRRSDVARAVGRTRPRAGAATGSDWPAEPATTTSTSRAWSMTQVMSPRRTSQRRASRSASTSRWRRTAPCRAETRSRTWAASSNRCWAARRDISITERFGDHGRITGQRPFRGAHGGVVRHLVGEPGARTLRDAELGGDTRCGIDRGDVRGVRAWSSTAATATPRGSPRPRGTPSSATAAARGAHPCVPVRARPRGAATRSRCRAGRSSTCRRACRRGCSGGACSRSGGSRRPRPTANRGASRCLTAWVSRSIGPILRRSSLPK